MNIEYESKSVPTRASSTENQKFICNLIINDENLCLDKKLRRQSQIRNEWRRHMQRLEILAQPKKYYEHYDGKNSGDGVPLERLLPRLQALAVPKYFTPKYVKPPEEPYQLPGKIKDWEAHKKWLEVNAQPKRLPKPKLSSFRTPTTRISEANLRRILKLSRPKRSFFYPETPNIKSYNRFSLYETPSQRTLELSQPKYPTRCPSMNEIKCFCCCPNCHSKLLPANYEASDRIKSLAIPRKYPKVKCRKRKHKKGHSMSFSNLLFKDENLQVSQRVSVKTA